MDAPEGFDIPKKSKNGKEVAMQFDMDGIYYYWCTPHKGMGMIGLVVVDGDVSNIDDIAKAKAMGKSKNKLKELVLLNDKTIVKWWNTQTHSCN